MENQDNIESKRQGKLLIMQLLLDIEELKYFLIEDLATEKKSYKCVKDFGSDVKGCCTGEFCAEFEGCARIGMRKRKDK